MIRFEHVTKRYPDGTVAVTDLTLDMASGETTVLVGSSGCGKTTVLRMINRLIDPTDGIITIDGEDVRQVAPPELRRGIGYVIQSGGLFPHRTVADNIATVPKLLGWSKDRIVARTAELLDLVGLDTALAERYPAQLSGGQQQRVGVARALAADPPVLLMDEPFGAVDPIVRTQLQGELADLQRRLRKTIVFVTHDIDEAIVLADRLVLLSTGGVIEQVGHPAEVFASPANDFVRSFLGRDPALRRLSVLPVSAAVLTALPTAQWSIDQLDQDSVSWLARDGRRARTAMVRSDGDLRAALDAALVHPDGLAAVVDGKTVVGAIAVPSIMAVAAGDRTGVN